MAETSSFGNSQVVQECKQTHNTEERDQAYVHAHVL